MKGKLLYNGTVNDGSERACCVNVELCVCVCVRACVCMYLCMCTCVHVGDTGSRQFGWMCAVKRQHWW